MKTKLGQCARRNIPQAGACSPWESTLPWVSFHRGGFDKVPQGSSWSRRLACTTNRIRKGCLHDQRAGPEQVSEPETLIRR